MMGSKIRDSEQLKGARKKEVEELKRKKNMEFQTVLK